MSNTSFSNTVKIWKRVNERRVNLLDKNVSDEKIRTMQIQHDCIACLIKTIHDMVTY